jgi:hypothetical protein
MIMSQFVVQPRLVTGTSRFDTVRFTVRETSEDLDVWALRGTPEVVAQALAAFLDATARDVPAHVVRGALAPFSDLAPLVTPLSAVQQIPVDWVPFPTTLWRRPTSTRQPTG